MGKTYRTVFGSNVQPRRRIRQAEDWVCDVCGKFVKKTWFTCPHCGEGTAV